MQIEIKEVAGRGDLRKFIYLPEQIHAGHDSWVHPIFMDDRKYFDPARNKSFAYCETTRVLAWREGIPVGRIMGIINSRYNEIRGERTARFGYLESWEEPEVVAALLNHVEEWARGHGMEKVVGPYGFSDQDPEGYLIDNFEDRATIATNHNFPWMPDLVAENGYEKDIDYVVYKIDVPEEVPEFYRKIHKRVLRSGKFMLHEFNRRSELKSWIRPVLRLMNECYSSGDIYGYTPLDEGEMDDLARRYLPILDPRLLKLVTHEGEIVAFVIGMPDLSKGIRRARGRLFPFGFLHIVRAAKRTKQLDLLLGAIKEEFRGRGLDVLMGTAMLESARTAGLEIIDTHHEMETNTQVRAEMERMGGEVYKRYRVFTKAL
ncbi:hypothetical protein ACFL4Y_03995 [Gemmatimonadota bacterium]